MITKKNYRAYTSQVKIVKCVLDNLQDDENFWERAEQISERIYRKHGVYCFCVRYDMAKRIAKNFGKTI